MSDVETLSEFNPMTEWNVDWTSTILPELLHESPIHVNFLDPDTGYHLHPDLYDDDGIAAH